MALRTCLYCGEKIYEHDFVCPKCNNSEPFDATVKAKKEATNKIIELNKEREFGSIPCKECGTDLKIQSILNPFEYKDGGRCYKCGFPDNLITCELCSDTARYYDRQNNKYTCYRHLSQQCIRCNKWVQDNERKKNDFNAVFCESCYSDYVRGEFFSNNKTILFLAGFLVLIILMVKGCS